MSPTGNARERKWRERARELPRMRDPLGARPKDATGPPFRTPARTHPRRSAPKHAKQARTKLQRPNAPTPQHARNPRAETLGGFGKHYAIAGGPVVTSSTS
ncbi:hypothetical protein PSCLAVI8L_60201 [Pseudoclavibacter sp. 8L]|nr:hypothetical protein PSCLAVI8L_60201 [Pseudoclavibacter sp. 8L]